MSDAVIQSSTGSLYGFVWTMARISALVKAMTCFAAQNLSSGRRFANGAIGWLVVHEAGQKVWASQAPASAKSGSVAFIHAGSAPNGNAPQGHVDVRDDERTKMASAGHRLPTLTGSECDRSNRMPKGERPLVDVSALAILHTVQSPAPGTCPGVA